VAKVKGTRAIVIDLSRASAARRTPRGPARPGERLAGMLLAEALRLLHHVRGPVRDSTALW
jgi:hypothetical protein